MGRENWTKEQWEHFSKLSETTSLKDEQIAQLVEAMSLQNIEKHSEEEEISKFDSDIQTLAARQEEDTEELIDYAKQASETKDSEQVRLDDKKSIEGMVSLYRIWAEDDKELNEVLDLLDSLAGLNVTSGSGYWDEGKAFDQIISRMEKYNAGIDALIAKNEKETKEKFKVEDKDNLLDPAKTYWLNEEQIKEKGLEEEEKRLSEEYQLLGEKRSIANSIINFMQASRNGNLMVPDISEEEKRKSDIVIINQSYFDGNNADGGKNEAIKTDQIDRSYEGYNWAVDLLMWTGRHVVGTIDASKDPLFPHEPNGNDVKQGGIGDCYFVAELSNIARLYPEKIRRNMVDNNDGTVTVRLYGKDEKGKHFPVYVTVDKQIPTFGGKAMTQGGENCVWVNCYEKALAISGLYDSYEKDRKSFRPVPPYIQTVYNKFKEMQDKGKLTQEIMKQERNNYPWIFSDDTPVVFRKYPNIESIIGGHGGPAAEILLGDGFEMERVDIEHLGDPEKSYINLKPRTPMQLMAVIMAGRDIAVDNYDIPNTQPDLSLPEDQLLMAAFNLSDRYKNNPEYYLEGFEQAARDLTKYIKNNTKADINNLSCEELVGYAFECFKSGPGNAILTQIQNILPLLNKPDYSKEQIALFNRIKTAELNNALVSAGSRSESISEFTEVANKEDLKKLSEEEKKEAAAEYKRKAKKALPRIAGSHEYSVLGAYIDESGRRMVRVRNPWGSTKLLSTGLKTIFNPDGTRTYEKIRAEDGVFDMELKDFIHDMDEVDFNGYDRAYENISFKHGGNQIESRTEIRDLNIFTDPDAVFSFIADSVYCKSVGGMRNAGRDIKSSFSSTTSPLKDELLAPIKKAMGEKGINYNHIRRAIDRVYGYLKAEINKSFEDKKESLKNCKEWDNKKRIEFAKEVTRDVGDLLDRLEKNSNDPKNVKTDMVTKYFCHEIRKTVLDKLSTDLSGISQSGKTQAMTETEEAFQKIQKQLENKEISLKIKDTNPKDKGSVLENFAKITSAGIDDKGMMYVNIIADDRDKFEQRMSFAELYNRASDIIVVDKTGRVIEPKKDEPVRKEKLISDGKVDKTANIAYADAVNTIYRKFKKTDRWYDKSSEEYRNLRDAVKSLRYKLGNLNGKAMSSLSEHLESLNTVIQKYEKHCNDVKIDNDRRNTRVDGLNQLKNVIEAARKNYRSPLDYRRDVAMDTITKQRDLCRSYAEEAYNKLDIKKFVEQVSGAMYLKTLETNSSNMKLTRLEDNLKVKVATEYVKKVFPLVASVLAKMDKKEMDEAFVKKDFVEIVNKKMGETFKTAADVFKAEKEFKDNVNRIKGTFEDYHKEYPVGNIEKKTEVKSEVLSV